MSEGSRHFPNLFLFFSCIVGFFFLFSLHICTFCLFPEPVCILTDVASTFPFGSLRTACQPGIYNDVNPVKQSCYNLFNAWTGSGRERWEIKLYGNKTVQVRMNGALLDQSESEIDACGAVGFGLSPRIPDTNHSIFELSFKASEGSFGVKLSSPGPSKKTNLFWGDFFGGYHDRHMPNLGDNLRLQHFSRSHACSRLSRLLALLYFALSPVAFTRLQIC